MVRNEVYTDCLLFAPVIHCYISDVIIQDRGEDGIKLPEGS